MEACVDLSTELWYAFEGPTKQDKHELTFSVSSQSAPADISSELQTKQMAQ